MEKKLRAVVVGAGVIGLSIARELSVVHAASPKYAVTVLDPHEPGTEASYAAAGMLAPDSERHADKHFRALQTASRDLYPDFVKAVEKESGKRVGFRTEGTLYVTPKGTVKDALREPELIWQPAQFFPHDYSLDPRMLTAALMESCKRRGVEFRRDAAARVETGAVILEAGGQLDADVVVNAAGSWSAQIPARGVHLDVRPVKGQICAVRADGWKLRHTVRDDHVYLVPRNDGRVVVGATMEDVGYDKSVEPAVIRKLLEAGARLVPKIRNAELVESWAGLRPATRSGLPLIGATKLPGYFLATGHLRDGVLLAPVTAKMLVEVIRGGKPAELLRPFMPGS